MCGIRVALKRTLTLWFPASVMTLLAVMGLQLWLTPRALGGVGIALGSFAWGALTISAFLLAIPQVAPRQSPATRGLGLGWYAAALRLLLHLILMPVSFALMCQQFFVVFGGFTGTGVRGNDAIVALIAPPSGWIEFAIAWLVDSVTFSASQVFGLTETSIQSTTWWSGALVVLYSFVAQWVVLAAIFNVLRLCLAALWRRLSFDSIPH